MAKPSRKKTASRRRKPAQAKRPAAPKPVEVVETAPAPREPESTEELKQEIAAFDHDGDGHIGGSKPHQAEDPCDVVTAAPEPQEPVQADVEEQTPVATDEPTIEADAAHAAAETFADEPEVVEAEAPAPAAPFRKCMVGPVEARVGRVPLGAVLGLLDPDGLRRIEAEKSTASFEATCKRLLATDGQATPVVFSQTYDKTERPNILHGYQELAAAQASGVNDVTVILIPPGGASEAQTHIVEMVRQQRTSEQPSTDDDLFYRVHAEG